MVNAQQPSAALCDVYTFSCTHCYAYSCNVYPIQSHFYNLMLFQDVYNIAPQISLQVVTIVGSSISILALCITIALLLIPRFV